MSVSNYLASIILAPTSSTLHFIYFEAKPDIIHPPAAPASITLSILLSFIPPIAYTGSFVIDVILLTKSRPAPLSPGLQSVSKTVPRIILVAHKSLAVITSSLL